MEATMEEALLATAATEKRGDGGEAASEVKKQLSLAGPLVAGFLLQNLLKTISVMFVGHLGELALSSASVATSIANVTGFSLLLGMACALDTLCGQAFGAGQYEQLGVYKQRAMLVVALVSVPVAALWAYTGEILAWCGQDPAIAAGAGSYIRWMIPALLAYGLLQCHARFLQTQNLVVPVMLSSAATAAAHPAVCWLLVRRLGLGTDGAAMANTVSYLVNLALLAVYVRLSPSCRATWTGFSGEAFRGIPSFLKLAMPSAVMMCMKWWAFELLVLLSGLLPDPKLETAVLSISLNTNDLVMMVPLGLSSAVSTRVSNELGAGRPEAARLATRVAVLLALAVSVSEGIVMVMGRNLWGYAYSYEEEVARYTAKMMPILAASGLFDSQQIVISGVIRGCGRQKAGAYINLAAYYLAGIPAAIILAFICHLGGMVIKKNPGLKSEQGLWIGISCGLVVQMLLLLSITLCTNWSNEASKAKERVSNSAVSKDITT
ncbi:hypothetical protein ACP70R_015250 [Stipagrostis hirtigluma subsp. patula]